MDSWPLSREIGHYLPAGQVTTSWQLAVIPLESWPLNWTRAHSFLFSFNPAGPDAGTMESAIYLDEVKLTQRAPGAHALTPQPRALRFKVNAARKSLDTDASGDPVGSGYGKPADSRNTVVIDRIDGADVSQLKPSGSPDNSMIDDMNDSKTNSLGGRTISYQSGSERCSFEKADGLGKIGPGLKLTYDLKNIGGVSGGGFAGYYTILHRGRNDCLDLSAYKYFTFWIRGEQGVENFRVGAADRTWSELDDSAKSKEIGEYLPAGAITTDWQLAVIPVDEWFIDWKQMHAFSICFEHDCFPNGIGRGTVYIDEMAMTKTRPAPLSPGAPPGPKSAKFEEIQEPVRPINKPLSELGPRGFWPAAEWLDVHK
jgi:hypothetical protein